MIWLFIFCFLKHTNQITLDQNCKSIPNSFYNTYLFECSTCGSGFNYNEYLKRCVCPPGTNYTVLGNKCSDCPEASSRDGMTCMDCPPNGPFNSTERECNCEMKVIVETNLLGFKDKNKNCIDLLPLGSNSRPNIYPENVCRNGQEFVAEICQCDELNEILSQNICILKKDLTIIDSSFSINTTLSYNNIDNINDPTVSGSDSESTSGLILYYYYKAARDCLFHINLESCQVIANLCVLRLYDTNITECRLYRFLLSNRPDDIINSYGWIRNNPWLYYNTTTTTTTLFANATDIIMNPNRISFTLSYDPADTINVNLLQFYMAKFHMNGTFVGFQEVNREFILCTKKYSDSEDYRRFGNTIVNECEINLSLYLNRDYLMYFYEVFLKNTNSSDPYVDIPVVIKNIPNNNDTNMNNWVLTRRFFLIDNLLSVSNYSNPTSTADFITYAKSFKFVIQLQNTAEAKMFVPYIEILYRTRRASDLALKPQANVAFISEYSMNIDSFMNVCLALLITIAVISVIAASVQMYTWVKVNPSDLLTKKFCMAVAATFMFKAFRFFGFLIFWFIFFISAYWYIFFKLQYRVFLLLPPLDTYDLYYNKFDIVFGVGFGAYCLYIFYRIYLQTSYDIYFIDWEQDKEMLQKSLEKREQQSTSYRYRGAWRKLQVVNQFFELQKRSNISFYFCIIWVILMYYRVDWWDKELQVPTIVNIEHSPVNFILRHFVTSFILLVCGFTQFIIKSLFQFWIPLKTVEFLDLCSVSNISIFILTDYLRGYYIHGKTPGGKADANLDELLRFLERESKGATKDRGISNGQTPEMQTFEFFMSYAMRTVYDGLYTIQSEASLITKGKKANNINGNSRLATIFNQLPPGVQNNNYFSDYMNNQLKHKIETIQIDPRSCLFDKLAYDDNVCNKMVSLFVGYPPSLRLMDSSSRDITLFTDRRMNYDTILFSGMEFEWFIFEVFMFQMWMRALGNMEIAFFLTFVVAKSLLIVRNYFVERNLGKKSIIDTRFIS